MRCPAFLIFAVARRCGSKLRGSRWLAEDGLDQHAGGKTVAEQGVSDEKDLLTLIKTVFAKLDSRLV